MANEQFQILLSKMESMEGKMDSMENRMESMEGRIESIEGRIESIEEKVDSVDQRVTLLENNVSDLNKKVDETNREVVEIKLTLENETNPYIRTVAQSHLDLYRKINEALPEGQVQMLYQIKTDMLGRQVDALEKKVDLLQIVKDAAS